MPLFIPLKKEYFQKFKAGLQDCEIRPNNRRGWNMKNVYPGRLATLSNGYGKHDRITVAIHKTEVAADLHQAGVDQWHIDAVKQIYGERDSWLIAYVSEKVEWPSTPMTDQEFAQAVRQLILSAHKAADYKPLHVFLTPESHARLMLLKENQLANIRDPEPISLMGWPFSIRNDLRDPVMVVKQEFLKPVWTGIDLAK